MSPSEDVKFSNVRGLYLRKYGIPYALFSKRCNTKECDWVSMTSLGLLEWHHYVRQQPPTVVPAKAKADIANAHSIPVFVVSYSHPIFWTMIRGYIFLKYYMLKKKYRMIINHSWILTPWINIVGLKKVGLKYKIHGLLCIMALIQYITSKS